MLQKKPLTVTCHLCAREFGLSSLPVHMPQCEKKWLANEQVLPLPLQRTVVPDRPSTLLSTHKIRSDIERYNAEANEIYRASSLCPCPGCHRSFNPEALVTHLRSCTTGSAALTTMPNKRRTPTKPSGGSVGSSSGSGGMNGNSSHSSSNSRSHSGGSGSPQQSSPSGPPALTCYLCGRQFGTSSLEIHLPQCEKKRMAIMEDLPPHLRQAAPRPPTVPIPERGPRFQSELEEYNEQAYRIYEESSRFPCTNCKRRFNAEALLIHLKSCGGSAVTATTATTASSSVTTATAVKKSQVVQRPRALMCCICGQGFGSRSLAIHQRTCMVKHGWTQEQLNKVQSLDRIGPLSKMSDRELDRFNAAAFESYSTHTLASCPNCSRTFLPDRLEVHLRSCKPGSGSKPVSRPASSSSSSSSLSRSLPSLSTVAISSSVYQSMNQNAPLKRQEPSSTPSESHNKLSSRMLASFQVNDEQQQQQQQ